MIQAKTKLIGLIMLVVMTSQFSYAQKFNKELQAYVNSLSGEFDQISEQREKALDKIADYTYKISEDKKTANAMFICTHNSRRSHLSQVWFQVASYYYGVENVKTYSGGTEETAFNPRAVNALRRAGVQIQALSEEKNPRYKLIYGKRYKSDTAFSKKFEDASNPQKGFFAVMVCSDADESCPVVPGADDRFSLPFIDPKVSDNTSSEIKTYDERCRQIAREMFYIMSRVKKQMAKKQ